MRIVRHYFVSNDLDDLENLEVELEQAGVSKVQVHVLTLDDAAAENHKHLHDVTSVMKTDVVHSSEVGAVIGLVIAVAVLLASHFLGWAAAIGWLPIALLAFIILGFATWEGGFIGIQRRNTHFKRFEKTLQDGDHIFFVDLKPGQENVLEDCLRKHPGLSLAGTDRGTPNWLMRGQQQLPQVLVGG